MTKEATKLLVKMETGQSFCVNVSKDTLVETLCKCLKINEKTLLIYKGQTLNRSFSFGYYNMQDTEQILCVSKNKEEIQKKADLKKMRLLNDILREKARVSDLAQLCIDNNPRKYRRYLKIYTENFNNEKQTSETTKAQYESPISPSSSPLPVSWD